jgi:cell division septum initiation protein DivIVA
MTDIEKKSIDISIMPEEQAAEIAEVLNKKIQVILSQAQEDSNRLLNLYQLSGTITIDIIKKQE